VENFLFKTFSKLYNNQIAKSTKIPSRTNFSCYNWTTFLHGLSSFFCLVHLKPKRLKHYCIKKNRKLSLWVVLWHFLSHLPLTFVHLSIFVPLLQLSKPSARRICPSIHKQLLTIFLLFLINYITFIVHTRCFYRLITVCLRLFLNLHSKV